MPKHVPHGYSQVLSNRLKLFRRKFARPRIGDQLEADLLTFAQIVHSGTFNRADMNESVLATVIGLNEAVAFHRIVPLHCAYSHDDPFRMSALRRDSTTRNHHPASILGGTPRRERLRPRKAKVVQPNFEAHVWRSDTALSRGLYEVALWP